MPPQRSRLTLDISQRMNESIERLAEKEGVSKADVIRRAIELLIAADTSRNEGFTIGAWKEESGLRTERVFVLLT